MTWLLFLNYYILQWLFIRLARKMEDGKQTGWRVVRAWPLSGFNGRPWRYWPAKKPKDSNVQTFHLPEGLPEGSYTFIPNRNDLGYTVTDTKQTP